MMKVLAEAILRSSCAPAQLSPPCVLGRALGRAELETLFQDDLAAHAMIITSRKAARAIPDWQAA
jgi:hypothetical protein